MWYCWLLFFLFACSDASPDDQPVLEDVPLKILMVGNSHTYYNDMPDMLSSIANSLDEAVEVTQLTQAGAAFQNHIASEANQQLVQSEKWDYAVLQENAAVAARPQEIAEDQMYAPAKTLVDWIKSYHQPCQVYYYLTHAYSVGAPWCDEDPLVCDYDGMLAAIRSNFIELDDMTPAQVAPAGVAWKILFNEFPDIELHDADTVHPNELGSYVSACTIFTSLFKKPLGLTAYRPEAVSEAMAQDIFAVVNALVLDGQPDWRTY